MEWLEERLTPATFTVNTFGDTVAVNLSNGEDAQGNVSLRSGADGGQQPGRQQHHQPAHRACLGKLTLGGTDGPLTVSNNLTLNGGDAGAVDTDDLWAGPERGLRDRCRDERDYFRSVHRGWQGGGVSSPWAEGSSTPANSP